MLEEGHSPISARLAEELGVTPPAVTAALKRLTRDDLVRVGRTGHIDLSRKGRQFAERMEHAISPEVEALLLKRFCDRSSCPHGVPIGGGIGQLRKLGVVLLSDL